MKTIVTVSTPCAAMKAEAIEEAVMHTMQTGICAYVYQFSGGVFISTERREGPNYAALFTTIPALCLTTLAPEFLRPWIPREASFLG